MDDQLEAEKQQLNAMKTRAHCTTHLIIDTAIDMTRIIVSLIPRLDHLLCILWNSQIQSMHLVFVDN